MQGLANILHRKVTIDAKEKITSLEELVHQCREIFQKLDELLPEDYDASYPIENGHCNDVQQSVGMAEECLDEALAGFRLALSPPAIKIYLVTTTAVIKATYEIEAVSPSAAQQLINNLEMCAPPVDTQYQEIHICEIKVKEISSGN